MPELLGVPFTFDGSEQLDGVSPQVLSSSSVYSDLTIPVGVVIPAKLHGACDDVAVACFCHQ